MSRLAARFRTTRWLRPSSLGATSWTEESRRWLRDIHQYIARDSPDAARKVVRGIFDRTHLVLEFPEMGHLYEPRKYPKVRILLYGHYRVLYLPEANGDIYVFGIFHGALELKRHFKPKGQRPLTGRRTSGVMRTSGERAGVAGMRKLGVLSLALAFSGCLAGAPLAPGDPETVDDALIGKWRCIGFDDDAEVGVLTVARKDPKTYEVEASGEPRPSKWEAFTVTVEKDRFINVRDLDSSSDEPWTLLRFTLYRPNLLYLEAVRYEEWKVRRKDFRKALLDSSTRETLFEDYLSCVRTDKR